MFVAWCSFEKFQEILQFDLKQGCGSGLDPDSMILLNWVDAGVRK
jgi:hypothetical protein